MHKLAYMPIARQDMVDIVRYIGVELANPAAAENLAVQFIESAEKLLAFPYSHPLYFPIKPLKHEYRKVPVQNYILFYRVEEQTKTVAIARVIYGGRDYEKLLCPQ